MWEDDDLEDLSPEFRARIERDLQMKLIVEERLRRIESVCLTEEN